MEPETTSATSQQARNDRTIWRPTLSGAHIRPLSESEAKAFLERNGTPMLQPSPIALGAFEDDGTLIGVLAVSGSPPAVSTIHLAVTPERRRLKLATDLVQALAADHLRPEWHFKLCRAIHPHTAEALQAWINQPRSRSHR